MPKNQRYTGKLHYLESDEYLDVSALIVREGEIAFALTSVIEYGRWESASGTVAKFQGNGAYLAGNVVMSNGPKSELWDIRFCIVHDESGQPIELSGEISRAAETYQFSGELEPTGR